MTGPKGERMGDTEADPVKSRSGDSKFFREWLASGRHPQVVSHQFRLQQPLPLLLE